MRNDTYKYFNQVKTNNNCDIQRVIFVYRPNIHINFQSVATIAGENTEPALVYKRAFLTGVNTLSYFYVGLKHFTPPSTMA